MGVVSHTPMQPLPLACPIPRPRPLPSSHPLPPPHSYSHFPRSLLLSGMSLVCDHHHVCKRHWILTTIARFGLKAAAICECL